MRRIINLDMDKLLTLACSTYGSRIESALALCRTLEASVLPKYVKLILVHQVASEPSSSAYKEEIEGLSKNDWFTYHSLESLGLTKSRNIALEACKTQFVWIMDDDIDIFVDNVVSLIRQLPSLTDKAVITTEGNWGLRRKKYPKNGAELTDKNILRVASCEMFINKKILQETNVRFREDMGVGGNEVIIGEEAVFLSDLKKKGFKHFHKSIATFSHPEESTGSLVSTQRVFSKGVVIKRCFSGVNKIRFLSRDCWRIMRNRDHEYGDFRKKIRLASALIRGCLF